MLICFLCTTIIFCLHSRLLFHEFLWSHCVISSCLSNGDGTLAISKLAFINFDLSLAFYLISIEDHVMSDHIVLGLPRLLLVACPNYFKAVCASLDSVSIQAPIHYFLSIHDPLITRPQLLSPFQLNLQVLVDLWATFFFLSHLYSSFMCCFIPHKTHIYRSVCWCTSVSRAFSLSCM